MKKRPMFTSLRKAHTVNRPLPASIRATTSFVEIMCEELGIDMDKFVDFQALGAPSTGFTIEEDFDTYNKLKGLILQLFEYEEGTEVLTKLVLNNKVEGDLNES